MNTPLFRTLVFLASAFSILTPLHAADAPAITPDKVDLKFSFGPQPVPGFTQVKPDDNYTIERGYGFDLSSTVSVVDNGGNDPLKSGYVIGAKGKPFFFSVKLVPGVYDVKVTLGDAKAESTTTVKSETRRLMLEAVKTLAGKTETKEFYVHLRVPQYPGGSVGLKPRENMFSWIFVYWEDTKPMTIMELDWDEKLTLEFSDAHPALCTVEITNAEKPLTVYLVGDSTMTDQNMEPWGAWGMQFPRWFKPPVAISNYAESGESAVSFIGERRWPKLMSEVHPGDYILIQFGINDRATPIDRFKQALVQMVTEARAKGAIPVIVTSQNLRSGFWGPDGKGQQTLGGYPYAMWEVATEQKTPYIDLNVLSTKLYEAFGQDRMPELFTPHAVNPSINRNASRDSTHHSDFGSYELAKCVVQACIDAKLPFAQSVVDDWKTFDPSHPDSIDAFKLPLDPQYDPDCKENDALPKVPVPVAGQPGRMADPRSAAAPARGAASGRGPAGRGPRGTAATAPASTAPTTSTAATPTATGP